MDGRRAGMPANNMHELRTGSGEHLAGVLGMGMALLIVFALGLFLSGKGNIPGQEPSTSRAVFYVINAATLTGFELTTSVGEYKPAGQITIFALIVAATFLSLVVGGW